MRPKLEACLKAINGGVSAAHILDGRVAHSLLLELFTDAGVGTKWKPADERRRASADRGRAVLATYAACPWSSSAARARACGTRTATSTSTSCAASRSRASGTATRASSRPSASRRAPDPRRNLFCSEPAIASRSASRELVPRRARVLLQLRRRGHRGGDQARAQGTPGRRHRGRASAPSTGAPWARCRRPRRSQAGAVRAAACPASAPCRRRPRRCARPSTAGPRR